MTRSRKIKAPEDNQRRSVSSSDEDESQDGFDLTESERDMQIMEENTVDASPNLEDSPENSQSVESNKSADFSEEDEFVDSIEVKDPASYSQVVGGIGQRTPERTSLEDSNLLDAILSSPMEPKSQKLKTGVPSTAVRMAPVLLGPAPSSSEPGSGGLLAPPEIEDEFLQSSPNPPEEMECCDDEMQCYLEIIPEQGEYKIQDSRDASEDERMPSDTSRSATPLPNTNISSATPLPFTPITHATPPGPTPEGKRGRGRPKGVKNKIKISVKPGAGFTKSGNEVDEELESLNSSATSTPRNQSPISQVPVSKQLEKMKIHNKRRNSQDKGRQDHEPVDLLNSNNRPKPRRRTSKFSESEDSTVSTDSPLNPRNFSKVYTGGVHSVHIVQGDQGVHSSQDTETNEITSSRMEISSEITGSPREEQPLIPKSYLQKKKLEENKEKEKKEKEDKEEEKKLTPEERRRQEEEDRRELEKRLKSFKHITENLYLFPKKINKQFRKMQCDCEQSREELENGEKGCHDDCANRMLMIECGKDCPLEANCANKRFQNKENAPIEVFRTDWKGFGVRATKHIQKDTFIMEYVGEALDHKQFRRRAKQYSRNNVEHFYFMALSKDCYVDATNKGNISRFINHSCDPNSVTQKWMVNGENRVGFFTKRDVEPGEELNFDYKYERYGQAAQKCYCGTSICRGWLGREPASDSGIEEIEEWTTSEEEDEEPQKDDIRSLKEERRRVEKKEKRRKREKERARWREEEEWEEEIQRLSSSGIKNRIQTIHLCRLMVRAGQVESRLRLLQLISTADKPCKRLFLDYQGLRILSQWMQDLEWSLQDLNFKIEIEKLLKELPIPHRTMLKDSKVFSSMEVWSVATPVNPNPIISSGNKNKPNSADLSSRSESPSLSGTAASHPLASTSSESAPQSSNSSPIPPSSIQSIDMEIDTSSPIQTSRYIEEEEDLYPPGEEPNRDTDITDTIADPDIVTVPDCEDTDDDIQVVEEIGNPRSSSSRSSLNNMKLKVVGVDEVEGFHKHEDAGEGVARVLSAQAGVGGDEEEEQLGDILVLPVHREGIPLTEEEEKERVELISKVRLVQLRAKELLQVWNLLQEVFKIPKKERHKLRVEHEREADRHFSQGFHNQHALGRGYTEHRGIQEISRNQTFTPDRGSHYTPERSSHYTPERGSERGNRGSWNRYQQSGGHEKGRSGGTVVPRERRNLRLDDKTGRLCLFGLSREDRRTLFEGKIAEESRQKTLRTAIETRHAQCCRLLGLNPGTTPLFDSYPDYYLVGDRWLPMPSAPEDLTLPWVVPNMACLPYDAYRPEDPKFTNPRDIYPPGVCPQEPPPKPRIIKVPGAQSTDLEVMLYYEEMYKKAPKSPPSSPSAERAVSPKSTKKVIPPYPGHVIYSAPDTIIFDPETLRAPPLPPAPLLPPTLPVPDFSVKPEPSPGPGQVQPSPRPRDIQPSPRHRDIPPSTPCSPLLQRDPLLQDEDTPRSSRKDGAERRTSMEARILEKMKIQLNLNKSDLELSPDYRSPSPVQYNDKRSLTSNIRSVSPPSHLVSPPSNVLRPVSPPTMHQSTPSRPHTAESQEPVRTPRRVPPKTIDFLNSVPDTEIPFPKERQNELEICDASRLLYDEDSTFSSPAAGSRTRSPVRGISSLNVGGETASIVIRLPKRWKVCTDGEGRVYYYHEEERVAQWEPPTPEQEVEEGQEYNQYQETSGIEEKMEEVGIETNSTDEEEDEEESDEEEGKEEGEEGDEGVEDVLINQDQDLSASEKKMLLRIRDRSRVSKEERSTIRKLKRRRERERREAERELIQARYTRHRETGLVEEHVVPRDRSNSACFKEIRERLINKEEVLREIDREIREDDRREIQERAEQERLRAKKTEKVKREPETALADTSSIPAPRPAPRTTTAAADTSMDPEKKVRERFLKEMSAWIVKILTPYRSSKGRGQIKSSEDFKYLAKKLNHLIYKKERDRVRSIEELKITDKMKNKAAEYIKKKMNTYEKEYKPSPHR